MNLYGRRAVFSVLNVKMNFSGLWVYLTVPIAAIYLFTYFILK